MTVSLDTSVLIAVFTPDLHTAAAEALLASPKPVVVSDWAAAEFSAAIRLKSRQGIIKGAALDVLETSFEQWLDRLAAARSVEPIDHRTARLLIRRHPVLRAPDALHIAIALRLDAALATFDIRQAEAARLEGMAVLAP